MSPKHDRPATVDTDISSNAKQKLQNLLSKERRYFANTSKLRGAIGASCVMCHPEAANTHQTGRKYQTQLQRVALLRDTINWCIENPVKGKPLIPDDPRLRALEAYIIAQRNGTALPLGEHTDCEQNSIAAFRSSPLRPARRC